MPAIIETENLTKYYGKNVGIENLSLTVEQGEIFGFLGPNGAGKTTTINVLMNFLKPDAGDFRILGKSVGWGDYSYKKDIGFLPGELALPPAFTGVALLNYWKKFNGGEAPLQQRCLSALSLSEKELKRKTKEYSTGMKQKLGIVGALQHRPKLVILDEPTAGLDPLVKHSFLDLLKEFKSAGTTVFFSSHVLSEIEQVTDTTAIIRNGTLVIKSRIEDLKHTYHKRVSITFANSEELNKFTSHYECEHQLAGSKIDFIAPGNIEEMLNAVTGLHISDMNISDPTLEDIFLKYYDD